MNTSLLLNQLIVAIICSTVSVVTMQKLKGFLPNEKWVEPISALVAVTVGVLMARYYANYDWIACAWVGFFTMIGAEAVYKLVAEKLQTYGEKKEASVEPYIPIDDGSIG